MMTRYYLWIPCHSPFFRQVLLLQEKGVEIVALVAVGQAKVLTVRTQFQVHKWRKIWHLFRKGFGVFPWTTLVPPNTSLEVKMLRRQL